jgi:hypothetical protein
MYELFANLEGIEAFYAGPDKRLVSLLRFYNSKNPSTMVCHNSR